MATPEAIFNCPQCSRWLPPGTLMCPECGMLVYSDYLRGLALTATSAENEGKWPQARETWSQALAWLPPENQQYGAVEHRVELIDARLRAAAEKKAKWTRWLGPLAPAAMFLSKIKTLLLVASKAKFFLSFVLFLWVYWLFFGWRFGVGFALAILVHEMGHYVAARRLGLKVDLPVFIPGLGAYVRWYAMGVSLEQLSGIALAGPTFGLLSAGVFCALSKATGEPDGYGLFAALAHATAWLNLINLIPILGLDGAQATYALNRTQRWLVTATALIFFGLLHELTFLLIAGGMGVRLWNGGYPEKPSTRALVQFVLLLFLLGLVAYLFPAATLRYQR
jgi:Zn-dependent protease